MDRPRASGIRGQGVCHVCSWWSLPKRRISLSVRAAMVQMATHSRVGDKLTAPSHRTGIVVTEPVSARMRKFLVWRVDALPLASLVLASLGAGLLIAGVPLGYQAEILARTARSHEARVAMLKARSPSETVSCCACRPRPVMRPSDQARSGSRASAPRAACSKASREVPKLAAKLAAASSETRNAPKYSTRDAKPCLVTSASTRCSTSQ